MQVFYQTKIISSLLECAQIIRDTHSNFDTVIRKDEGSICCCELCGGLMTLQTVSKTLIHWHVNPRPHPDSIQPSIIQNIEFEDLWVLSSYRGSIVLTISINDDCWLKIDWFQGVVVEQDQANYPDIRHPDVITWPFSSPLSFCILTQVEFWARPTYFD